MAAMQIKGREESPQPTSDIRCGRPYRVAATDHPCAFIGRLAGYPVWNRVLRRSESDAAHQARSGEEHERHCQHQVNRKSGGWQAGGDRDCRGRASD
jgi:hypothetical protein